MKRHIDIISLLLCMAFVFSNAPAVAKTGISTTKHNLSKSGPGAVKATFEERICVFCHTPHNALPQSPLWNKNIQAQNYTLYSSSTLAATMSQPAGPSRLCLSCHDGTLALGEVRKPSSTIEMTTQHLSAGPSFLGITLEKNHPVSFSYYSSLPKPELFPALPAQLLFYGNGVIHCSTCHDPHDNTNKKFLAINSENSGLCTLCHTMTGWSGTPHSTAPNTWSQLPPNPWPRTGTGTDFGWTTVKQNGCENCHAPHNAAGPKRLLTCLDGTGTCATFTQEGNCYACHNGHVADQTKNIYAQFGAGKVSYHRVTNPYMAHDPLENQNPLLIGGYGHVECVDCHNPHMANNNKTVSPPAVSGRLDGVSGVTINGAAINPANNEYEICFKCHAETNAQTTIAYTPVARWSSIDYNTRLEFQTSNPSYHPVAGIGASNDVPSLRFDTGLTHNSQIYCTDCHSDDAVSRGPHGSQYAPILRDRYITTNNNVSYNFSNFKVCYNCHDESSILSDTTFQKNSQNRGGHSGHVGNPSAGNPVYAPCSACHDPHGVRDDGVSGSHKRLINFDTHIVSALPGSGFSVPLFSGSGNRSGTCALVCHGVTHDGSLTYSYGNVGNIQIRW